MYMRIKVEKRFFEEFFEKTDFIRLTFSFFLYLKNGSILSIDKKTVVK